MQGQDIAVPATFVIASDGTIRWARIGGRMDDRPSLLEVLDAADAARFPE